MNESAELPEVAIGLRWRSTWPHTLVWPEPGYVERKPTSPTHDGAAAQEEA